MTSAGALLTRSVRVGLGILATSAIAAATIGGGFLLVWIASIIT
ncbi:MAG: hypothetical protein ABIJ00_00180 [Candidatus Eisenbacteria bacterium]